MDPPTPAATAASTVTPVTTMSMSILCPSPMTDLERGEGGDVTDTESITAPVKLSLHTRGEHGSGNGSGHAKGDPNNMGTPCPVSPKLHSITPASSTMALSKPLKNYWEDYLQQLEENPITTKAITAGVLSVVSDIIAQLMTGASLTSLNITSLWHQLLIGLTIRGPVVHYWYLLLEEIFRRLGYGGAKGQTWPAAIGKMVLDQTTFGPFFNLFYFYVIGFLQNMSSADIKAKIAREYIPVMLMNYKIWPLVNILNFKVVPPHLRVLFGNIVSIAWTVYVIKLTSSGKK